MGVIYKTVNLLNGKIYVGRDKHNNPKYLGSGVLVNLAFEKYGGQNFRKEILEECDDEMLDEREKYWIRELDARNPRVGYNIAEGGHNDLTMNDYVRSKISETLKGKYVGEKAFRHGIKLSEDHRRKFTAHAGHMKGKTFDEVYGKERSANIRSRITGAWHNKSEEERKILREKISKSKKGVPLTEKQRESISEGMRGRVVSEETKELLRSSNLNKAQKHSIKLECQNVRTGEIFVFQNVEHARRTLGCSRYKLLQNKLRDYNVKRIE